MSKHATPAHPLAAALKPGEKRVNLTVDYGVPNFKWQMSFNAFSVEKVSNGCLVRFAYTTRQGDQTIASEIVPVILAFEGLEHLRTTGKQYIGEFGDVRPREPDVLPNSRQFSPLFANHARVSYAGGTGEIALFTVLLHDIANATKGMVPAGNKINCVQVALMHSDVITHRQLILEMLKVL